MQLNKLIEILDNNLNFTLYDADNDRVGIFRHNDIGIEQYLDRNIKYIDVIDEKLCIFLDCF